MAINSPVVYALDFSFDSPSEAEVNEEFEVTINAQTGDIYDVKIFVYHETKKREGLISEIYFDGAWKSSYYYLQDVFPAESKFKNKVLSFAEGAEICVRMRLAEQTDFDEICKEIDIKESSSPNTNSQNNNELDEEKETNLETKKIEVLVDENKNNKNEQTEVTNKKIVLNKAEEKKDAEESYFISKEEKVRKWVLYSFLGFCVVLIILLALKKL